MECIFHGLLITKMSAYGLGNKACEFMVSYLVQDIKEPKSLTIEAHARTSLLKGTLQGIVGSFLFNVFMNDIFYFIQIFDLAHNYDDDQTLDHRTSIIEIVTSTLQQMPLNGLKITLCKQTYVIQIY